jgi:transcription-repair coupling factor (superfamily II helicase)
LLVITPRPRDAEVFSQALRFFTKPEKEILCFPPWETITYDEIPPHHEIVNQRVRTLARALAQDGSIIATSIQALMQKAMHPHTLEELTIPLKAGDEIDREEFIAGLIQGGYTQVPVVEEKGDLSVRGGIIDLFSPSHRDPLRIEFFGDRIDSIRAFEAETQRSHRHYEGVSILPAKEIMDDSDDEASASLFDYLNPQTILAIDDLFEVEREGEVFWLEIKERFDRAIAKGNPSPLPSRWYFPMETIESIWGNRRTLLLGEMDIPELKEARRETLRFIVESNEEMSHLRGTPPEPGGKTPGSINGLSNQPRAEFNHLLPMVGRPLAYPFR